MEASTKKSGVHQSNIVKYPQVMNALRHIPIPPTPPSVKNKHPPVTINQQNHLLTTTLDAKAQAMLAGTFSSLNQPKQMKPQEEIQP